MILDGDCDDVVATWKGAVVPRVTIAQEPIDVPFGRWSLLQDTKGNLFPLTTRA